MAEARYLALSKAFELHSVPECLDCAGAVFTPGSMHGGDGGHVWRGGIRSICKASGTKIV